MFRTAGASKVNRYIQAGNAAANAGVQVSGGIAKNRPRYERIENERMKADADMFRAAVNADAKVTNSAVNAKARVDITKRDVEADKNVAKSKGKARMAGQLAAGAQLIGYSNYLKNKKDEPNSLLDICRAPAYRS